MLVSERVSPIKIYVQAAAPDTDDWTISDVNIIGAVGGSKGAAPVSIRDLGGHNRIKIKNVNITDFSFFAGYDSQAGSAWPGTSRGVLIESADNVRLRGRIEYHFDNTATSAWRHVETIDCNGLDLQVDTDRIGRGGGYGISNCQRTILRGEIHGSSDTDWQLVRLTSSDVDLQHMALLDRPLDNDAVLVVSGAGSKVRAVGGRWAHNPASTAGSGVGWASASDLTSLVIVGVDTSGMFAPIQSSYTSLAYLRVVGAGAARSMFGSATVTGNDAALPALRIRATPGHSGTIAEITTSGGTVLWSISSAGTMVASGAIRSGTRGTLGGPAYTFSVDTDTGLYSPNVDQTALVAGGVEVFKATSTKPTVSGSKGGNAALASLLTALASLELITDSTT